MMVRLQHSNFPRGNYHFVKPGGAQYLFAAHIKGELPDHALERSGPISEDHALPWIDQIRDGGGRQHTQSPPVIQRDIKPDHIEITPQGQVFLIDLGIASLGETRARIRTGALGVSPGVSPLGQRGTGGGDVYGPDLSPASAAATSAVQKTHCVDPPHTIPAFRTLLRPGAGVGPRPRGCQSWLC